MNYIVKLPTFLLQYNELYCEVDNLFIFWITNEHLIFPHLGDKCIKYDMLFNELCLCLCKSK